MSDLELKLVLKASDEGLTGAVQQVAKETEKLDASLDSSAKSTGYFSDKLSETDRAAGRTYDQMGRLRETNGRFVSGAKKATEQTDKLNEKLNKTAKRSKKAAKENRSFNDTLGKGIVKAGAWAAAFTAAVAVGSSFAATLNTEAIRETQVLAQTLDLSTQSLSEWEYAAAQVNVSGAKVGDIFKDVSDKIGDFITTGGGEAADLFENLNLQVKDLVNLSPDQQLLAIGDALDDVGNRGQQVFFLESLADDASRLLPLLENDAEQLKRLQLEAQVLGVSINDIDASKVAQAAQAFDRVKGLSKGLANDLTIELAPILGGIADYWVDASIAAGGYRGTIKSVIDYSVSGVGFVLDYLQQLRIVLKYSEKGWMMIGEAATGAMASVADSTARVINTVMYPFQKSIAWVIEKYSYLLQLGSEFGGPFADEFATAAQGLKGFSAELDQFSVSADDIIQLHTNMSASVAATNNELKALIAADAPSEVLKTKVEELRIKSEELAVAQQKLGDTSKTQTEIVSNQKDENTELVKTLEQELELLGLTERERKIEIGLRKLSEDATEAQRKEIARLTGSIYDYNQSLKESEAQAKPWADAWEASTERLDTVFADAWTGAFDGFDSFTDSLLDAFKQTLAEMAHLAFTKKFVLNITTAIGDAIGIQGVSSPGGTGNSLGSLTDIFNPSAGTITSSINNAASSLGYGYGADGMGPPTALINPNSTFATGLNSIAPGLSAYGFAQQYGAVGGIVGGAGSAAIAGGIGGLASGAGFMSGATGALAGLGPAGWAAIGVGTLLGLSGGGETRHGQEYGYDTTNGVRIVDTPSGGAIADEAMSAAVTATIDGINSALQTFGSTLTVSTFGAELETSEKGRGGVYSGGHLSSGTAFGEIGQTFEAGSPYKIDGEKAVELFMLDLQQVTLQALQASEIPGYVGEFLEELGDIEELEGNQLSAVLNHVNTLTSITEILESSAPLTALLPDTLDQVVVYLERFQINGEALGDTLSRFATQYDYFFTNFFSEQEQAAVQVEHYTAIVERFNVEFGAAIQSKDDLRNFVTALDLTGEAGQRAYQAAMNLAPALVNLEQSLSITGTGYAANLTAGEQGWITERSQQIADNYQDELTSINEVYTARKQQLQAELNAARQIHQAVMNIRLSDISPLTPAQRVSAARDELARLQVLIEDGNLDAAAKVGSAAQSYLSELASTQGASPLYTAEFDSVVNYLEELGLSLGSELDPLEAIQDLEKEQLKAQQKLADYSRRQLDLLAKQYSELVGLSSENEMVALVELLTFLPENISAALKGLIPGYSEPSTGSTEPVDYDFVSQLYNQGLNREADSEGFSYWMDRVAAGEDKNTLKDEFFSAAEYNGENVSYFASGGVVSRPQSFAFDSEISGQIGQRGEAGAEAIIPVGSGFIPAKFDNSLINELQALRKQNASQAQQLEKLNRNVQQLASITDKHGSTAQKQRNDLKKRVTRSNRNPVEVNA
ncbi:MAG: DUF4214 domain-containing protein [Neptuniibacter sp.]